MSTSSQSPAVTVTARVQPRNDAALGELDVLRERLAAVASDGEHLAQIHEFLDIDPDLAHVDYLVIENPRPAVTL